MYTTKIKVIKVLNPFNLSESLKEDLDYLPDNSILDYFPELKESGEEFDFIVSINGGIVHPEFWSTHQINPDDVIAISACVAGGGDGGKNIMRMVAMIAVAVVAAYTGGIAGAAYGSFAGAAAGAGVSIAGALAVNMLLPPAEVDKDSNEASNTYGIDGAKNTSQEGIATPIVYGKHRMAGNIIATHIENTGGNQQLYMLINAGFGPIAGITDIRINDQPAENFSNVHIQTRMGTGSQTPIPWFSSSIVPQYQGKTFTTEYQYFDTTTEVDQLRFDLVFPQGLFWTNDAGDILLYTVEFEIHVQPLDTPGAEWTNVAATTSEVIGYTQSYVITTPLEKDINLESKRYVIAEQIFDYVYPGVYDELPNYVHETDRGYLYIYVPGVGQKNNIGYVKYDWEYAIQEGEYEELPENVFKENPHVSGNQSWQMLRWEKNGSKKYNVGYVKFTPIFREFTGIRAAKAAVLRQSMTSQILPEQRYKVRFRRLSVESEDIKISDTLILSDINEITTEKVAHRHKALLGLSIQLTEQLSGIPNVTFVNHGKLIGVFNGKGWSVEASDNPAWQVWDAYTNKFYGGGLNGSRIDLDKFLDWAEHCEEKGLTSNIVIDEQTNLWDALSPIYRLGHAHPVHIGTKMSLAIERDEPYSMIYSVANMREGSFQVNWLPKAERGNVVEVAYYDEENDFEKSYVRVYDDTDFSDDERVVNIDLKGCTNSTQATQEAWLQLNMNRHILRTCEWESPLESVISTVGDIVLVQHDMPQWGFAGKIEKVFTRKSLKLDRKVTIEAGYDYQILLFYPAHHHKTCTVKAVNGKEIRVTESYVYDGVNRLKTATIETNIDSVRQDGDDYILEVDSVHGIGFGTTIELWATALSQIHNLNVNQVGEVDTVNLQVACQHELGVGSKWILGKKGIVGKLFRITGISADDKYFRKIRAVEYSASIHDGENAQPPPNASHLTSLAHSTIEAITEELRRVGNVVHTYVTVHVNNTSSLYRDTAVYTQLQGGVPFLRGVGLETVTFEAGEGVNMNIFAVARGWDVPMLSIGSSPWQNYTVKGKKAPPGSPKNFAAETVLGGVRLTWDEPDDLDIMGYHIRYTVGSQDYLDGTIVSNNHSGTSIFIPLKKAKNYVFWIYTLDTSENFSKIVYCTASISYPENVSQFYAQRTRNGVQLSWKYPEEDELLTYEIREGTAWNRSNPVTTIAGDFYFDQNAPDERNKYWIKAQNIVGLQSIDAVFATADDITNNQNIIVKADISDGFEGTFVGVDRNHLPGFNDYELALRKDSVHGEYCYEVVMQERASVRTTLHAVVDVESTDDLTWADANFDWLSELAARGWISADDPRQFIIRSDIALDNDGDWDNDLVFGESFAQENLTSSTPPSYGPGVTSLWGGASPYSRPDGRFSLKGYSCFGSANPTTQSFDFSGIDTDGDSFGIEAWVKFTYLDDGNFGVFGFSDSDTNEKIFFINADVEMDNGNVSAFKLQIIKRSNLSVLCEISLPAYTLNEFVWMFIGFNHTSTEKQIRVVMPSVNISKQVVVSHGSSGGAFSFNEMKICHFRVYDGSLNTQYGSAGYVISDLQIKKNQDTLDLEEFKRRAYRQGGVGYKDFTNFIHGEYTFTKALLRAVFVKYSGIIPKLTKYILTADVPDIEERGRDVGIAGTNRVTYTKKFLNEPIVVAAVREGTGNPTVKILDEKQTYFDYTIEDDQGNPIAGKISWSARGY